MNGFRTTLRFAKEDEWIIIPEAGVHTGIASYIKPAILSNTHFIDTILLYWTN